MPFALRVLVTVIIIILCAQIGKRFPTLAGLIATMPLTSLLVMLWIYADNTGNYELMKNYTRGVLWGIIPTILFFVVAYICFSKRLPFGAIMAASFAIWLVGAFVHQYFLKS